MARVMIGGFSDQSSKAGGRLVLLAPTPSLSKLSIAKQRAPDTAPLFQREPLE